MSGSSTPPSPETPHLVSLVLHSKKAYQHGEQLCKRANAINHGTSDIAASLLACDAKARWLVKGILEQLERADDVKRSIEQQRTRLEEQGKQWDETRGYHTQNLDNILESLQAQLVPPDFYQSSSASSIFGSQPSSDDEDKYASETTDADTDTPIATRGRESSVKRRFDERDRSHDDRRNWKTLRDFVHERGIEEETEKMDSDRVLLDDILAATEDFPDILEASIANLRVSLPDVVPLPSLSTLFQEQERVLNDLAARLINLRDHYDNMAETLHDRETGQFISEDDILEMNRDTNELPNIIAELEDGLRTMESIHDQLKSAQETVVNQLNAMRAILNDLDELEEVMSDMLVQQQNVEAEYEIHLGGLQQHLQTLEHLYMTYTSYKSAYNNLLVELDRRRQYETATGRRVREMERELEALRNEEIQTRENFYANYGPHLPDDLCLCIANMPTKYDVTIALGEEPEELPEIDEDLLADAIKHVDLAKAGSESL